jgi:hypothetical protein
MPLRGKLHSFLLCSTMLGGPIGTASTTLLDGETDGLAVDFTDTDDFALSTWAMQAVQERNSSVDTLQSPHVFFTQSGTSPKYVKDSSTTIGWSPHNLITKSQEVDDAAWTDTNTSETADTTVAPDGTTTADTLISDGTANARVSSPALTAVSGFQYTASVYLKAGTVNWGWVRLGQGTDHVSSFFDLGNGALGTASNSDWVVQNVGIESAGNGWYRCWITTTVDQTSPQIIIGPAAADNVLDVGANDTIIVWGAQVNRGYEPTAYIATTTAAKIALPISYSEGLLVEPAATNLCLQSQTFDSATWQAVATPTITADSAVAPDGSTTADTFNTGAGTQSLVQAITISASTNYSHSIYLKYVDHQWYCLSLRDNGGGSDRVRAWFDIQNGVKGTSAVAGSGVYTNHTMESVGNGWYRCTVTGTLSVTTGSLLDFPASGDGNTTNNASKSCYVWGAMWELGTVASSYVPTLAASATRARDDISALTSTFPFSATVGTQIDYVDVKVADFFSFYDDTTADERIYLNTGGLNVYDGAVSQIGSSMWSVTSGVHKWAGSWAANDFSGSLDGAAAVDDSSGSLPTITTFRLGSTNGATGGPGLFKYFIYVPRTMNNTELQAATA